MRNPLAPIALSLLPLNLLSCYWLGVDVWAILAIGLSIAILVLYLRRSPIAADVLFWCVSAILPSYLLVNLLRGALAPTRPMVYFILVVVWVSGLRTLWKLRREYAQFLSRLEGQQGAEGAGV